MGFLKLCVNNSDIWGMENQPIWCSEGGSYFARLGQKVLKGKTIVNSNSGCVFPNNPTEFSPIKKEND